MRGTKASGNSVPPATASPHCLGSLGLIDTVEPWRDASVFDTATSELAKIRAFATLRPGCAKGTGPAGGAQLGRFLFGVSGL
jgi:hypothetical protein